MPSTPHIVWLTELRFFGELVEQHAHYSVVRYSRNGFEWEIEIGNDEWEEAFEYEQD